MAVIRSGSRRSPEKRSVANAVVRGGASVDLVIDVADYRAEFVCHRAVIPYGDTIPAAQPGPSFDAMQGPAQLRSCDAENSTNFIRRISRISPNDARHELLYNAHPSGPAPNLAIT